MGGGSGLGGDNSERRLKLGGGMVGVGKCKIFCRGQGGLEDVTIPAPPKKFLIVHLQHFTPPTRL